MIKDYKISVPFFEFGTKAYLYGENNVGSSNGICTAEEMMAAVRKAYDEREGKA